VPTVVCDGAALEGGVGSGLLADDCDGAGGFDALWKRPECVPDEDAGVDVVVVAVLVGAGDFTGACFTAGVVGGDAVDGAEACCCLATEAG